MGFTIFVKRTRTALGDIDMAVAMAEVERVIAAEPDCASRSYLIQRVSKYLGAGDATVKVNNLIQGKAIKSVPGSRRGFPIVYEKSTGWNRMWTECHADAMDFETLKRMNQD